MAKVTKTYKLNDNGEWEDVNGGIDSFYIKEEYISKFSLLETLKDLEAHCKDKKIERAMQDMIDNFFPKIVNEMQKIIVENDNGKLTILD